MVLFLYFRSTPLKTTRPPVVQMSQNRKAIAFGMASVIMRAHSRKIAPTMDPRSP